MNIKPVMKINSVTNINSASTVDSMTWTGWNYLGWRFDMPQIRRINFSQSEIICYSIPDNIPDSDPVRIQYV